MDCESDISRALGSWTTDHLEMFLDIWSMPAPDFVIDDVGCQMIATSGFADTCAGEKVATLTKHLQQVYRGDEGRKKGRMVLMSMITRDSVLLRLRDVKCPVHWLQVRQSWHCSVRKQLFPLTSRGGIKVVL